MESKHPQLRKDSRERRRRTTRHAGINIQPTPYKSNKASPRRHDKFRRRKSQKVFWIKLVLVAALALIITTGILYGKVAQRDTPDIPSQNRRVPERNAAGRVQNQQQQQQQQQQREEVLYLGSAYTNPTIHSQGCSLTVLMMDPTLPSGPRAYIALESVAANVPQDSTCFLLQTTSCGPRLRGNPQTVFRQIQNRARPQFKSFITRGNVRVTILNHTKYHLRSCRNFYSPSEAWMMARYWDDEFVSDDSDLVLTVQHDCVLCHPLRPDLWREFAYVGAPWPPRANLHSNPLPEEGCCRYVAERWARWTRNQTKPINVCQNGLAPLGNGGLALRSRSWLKKAIYTCPHQHNDFYNTTNRTFCDLIDWAPEDLYFATVLRGLNATMPTAFEASLFSAEMLLPEQILDYYGLPNDGGETEMEEVVAKRWANQEDGLSGLELYRRMKQTYNRTIPVGFHKPWLYIDLRVLLSPQMENECPYLKDIIPQKEKAKARTMQYLNEVKQ